MAEDPKTDTKSGKAVNGGGFLGLRRIADLLLAIVGVFIIGWATLVFSKATSAEALNIQQEERIKALERNAEKVDTKLDEILRELRKRP